MENKKTEFQTHDQDIEILKALLNDYHLSSFQLDRAEQILYNLQMTLKERIRK